MRSRRWARRHHAQGRPAETLFVSSAEIGNSRRPLCRICGGAGKQAMEAAAVGDVRRRSRADQLSYFALRFCCTTRRAATPKAVVPWSGAAGGVGIAPLIDVARLAGGDRDQPARRTGAAFVKARGASHAGRP